MLIRVRVRPNARKETLIEVDESKFEISVKEKAHEGAANARAIVLIARHFRVPVKRVRILRGHRQASKIIELS